MLKNAPHKEIQENNNFFQKYPTTIQIILFESKFCSKILFLTVQLNLFWVKKPIIRLL